MPPTKRPASEVAEKEDAATKRLELDTKNAEVIVSLQIRLP